MPRRIVVSEFLSVDGVMEAPGGDDNFARGAWTFKFQDPEGTRYKLDEIRSHDALLLGRRTYEGFAAAWPGRHDEMGFAERMNSMQKYVVSTTLEEPLAWENSALIAGDAVEGLAALKEQPGGDIVVAGSRTLVQTLLEHDLADEYRLMVFPIVLGTGKRLFGETADASVLKLADSKVLDSGTVILTYRPARA
jgi:dihydrofolate reductase